eukprot:362232_1
MANVIIFCILSVVSYAFTPRELQQELNDAINDKNISSYTIPSNDYYFISTNFFINNAENFSIISFKKTILYFNCSFGIHLNNNFNLTLMNIVIDYNPTCFSQGIINSINTTELSIIVTIDNGYPLPDPSINKLFAVNTVKVIYWNQTNGEMFPGQTGFCSWNSSQPIKTNNNTNIYKIYVNNFHYMPSIGNAVTFGPRQGNTFYATNCSNMNIVNLTIYGSSNMAVYELIGFGHNIYDNYQLIRRPNSTHLLSSNADGFHSNSNMFGPILKNSYLEHTGDDFANVHNRINILLQRIDDYSLYVIDTWNGYTFGRVSQDNSIYFYELNTLNFIGYGIVNSILFINNQTLMNDAIQSYTILNNPPYNAGFVTDYRKTIAVYKIEFKEKLNENIIQYSLIEYDLGNGAMFLNNKFHNGHGHMIMLKSKNSIVKNNIFSYALGVYIKAEQNWLEGELGLSNVTVENNIFIGCGNETTAIVVQKNATNITIFNNTFI